MKAAKSRLAKAAAGLSASAAAWGAFPAFAWARPTGHDAAAQASVGALPLLAALGIGIAVAVGAVIAFLQLTAKVREPKDAVSEWTESAESHSGDRFSISGTPPFEVEDRAGEDDDAHELTDYTIPLARIPVEPALEGPVPEGEPRLCGVGGEFNGASFRLNGRGLSIGRDPAQCHIVFPVGIGEVSRRHCSLAYEEERRLFLLEDHGSSNGTFLTGGERLQPGKRYELRSGQRFALSGGVHWFEVRE